MANLLVLFAWGVAGVATYLIAYRLFGRSRYWPSRFELCDQCRQFSGGGVWCGCRPPHRAPSHALAGVVVPFGPLGLPAVVLLAILAVGVGRIDAGWQREARLQAELEAAMRQLERELRRP